MKIPSSQANRLFIQDFKPNFSCLPPHNSSCTECDFEREKRKVIQTAFEKMMSISMHLMEEIDKLSLSTSSKKG
jgi:hypothetical protein